MDLFRGFEIQKCFAEVRKKRKKSTGSLKVEEIIYDFAVVADGGDGVSENKEHFSIVI